MIVDGKAIAEEIYTELAPRFASLRRRPRLGIVVVGSNPVIESFVKIKMAAAQRLGVDMLRGNISERADVGKIVQSIDRQVRDTDAAIIQLPLPRGVSTDEMLAEVPNEKDVDALNPKIPENERIVHAPVALAVLEILKRSGVEIAGKKAVIVGSGRLVGAPSAWLLQKHGAIISTFSLSEGAIEDLKDADIIVSGAGSPGLIKPDHIKDGVVLIDAGTSELEKSIRGDADPSCAEKCSVFTPVPGGVGPVSVAMIFKNLLELLERGAA